MLHYRLRERRHDPGAARFLTFSCYQRLPLFQNDAIKNRFTDRLTAAASKHAVQMLAWVTMTDHVHLVLVSSRDRYCVSNFLHDLKTPFAREVINRWKNLDAPILSRLTDRKSHHFWQEGGGYDRNVVGDELLEKIRYIHRNPITANLAATSVDYAWSSARAFEQAEYHGPPIAFDLIPDSDTPLT